VTAGEPLDRAAEDPLGFALAAAARKLTKFFAAALAERPLTPAQLVVLRRLAAVDGQAMRDLAPRAGLDPTSLNWLVDQLEKAAFVERRRDAVDRRLVRVWLTDEGRALAGELAPEVARWEETVAAELRRHHTPAELATFRAVLATIVEVLPEGEDLWAGRIAAWEETLDALRRSLEEPAPDEGPASSTPIEENPNR
jgi:MarR family transcriptional regulator, organic hydroperoxide resistance regulator